MRPASLLSLFLFTLTASADDPQWQNHLIAGDAARRAGDYADAEKHFTAALEAAKAFEPWDPRVTATMGELATTLHLRGKYEQAATLLRRALETDELARGLDDVTVARSATALATVLSHQGKLKESEELYRRALAIEEKKSGRESLAVARTLS